MASQPLNLPYKSLALEGQGFKNPRRKLDKDRVKQIADQIAANNHVTRLKIWATKDDKGKVHYIVEDGQHRYAAIGVLRDDGRAKELSCLRGDKVPVDIDASSKLEDVLSRAAIQNESRANLSPYDLARECERRTNLGEDQKTIGASLGKSVAWVSRQLTALREASPRVLKAWEAGKISTDTVQDLCTLPVDKQVKTLADIIDKLESNTGSNGKPTREAKAAARKTAKEAAGKKTKSDKTTELKRPKPSSDKLDRYIEVCSKAKKKDRYVRGMLHALQFMNGQLGPGEFDKEWQDFAKAQGMYKTDAVKAAS